ncbi:MAG: PIN domain-containing protein [Acidobacteriota bacterium]
MRFVDTNVLLYAVSSHPAETAKAARAAALLNEPDLALSVQVIQEFYVQATRPASAVSLPHDLVVSLVDTLERFPIQETTLDLVRAAMSTAQRWQLSYWDAAIVEAARALSCGELLTEDLQHGQDFAGVRVVNPFV